MTQRIYKNFQIKIPDFDDPDLSEWSSLPNIKSGQLGKKPKYIEIQNLSSNIFTVAGYLMAINIKNLFSNTITWVDSLQGTVYYEEFNTDENSLEAEYEIEIKRLSGPNDLLSAANHGNFYYHPDGNDPDHADNDEDKWIDVNVDNGYLAFSLVFHY